MPTLKAAIFDYAGVISEHQSDADWQRLVSTAGAPADAFKRAYWDLRPPYDRGHDDGPSYWAKVATALHRDFSEDLTRQLMEFDTRSWIRMNDAMVAFLAQVQASQMKTAILSNMGMELMRHVVDAFPWVQRFDFQSFSCALGCAKPEAAIFHHCLRGLDVSPEEAVFIDDRMENIHAAEAVGLRGVHFTSAQELFTRIETDADLAPLRTCVSAGRGLL